MTALPQYTVIYFDVRGRAEPIRLTLALAGQPFEDRGLNREQWLALKPTLMLGQLPVLIERKDGEERTIPQSQAILRHLARTHGLYGTTEQEQLLADIAGDTAVDARTKLAELRYSPGWKDEAARARFISEVAPIGLVRLESLLADKVWFAAATPTWSDALVFDTLDGLLAVWPDCLDSHPTLAAFVGRFRALPALQGYLASRRPA